MINPGCIYCRGTGELMGLDDDGLTFSGYTVPCDNCFSFVTLSEYESGWIIFYPFFDEAVHGLQWAPSFEQAMSYIEQEIRHTDIWDYQAVKQIDDYWSEQRV